MILVIDDLAIFREPIAVCLRMAGYETVCAGDGLEGMLKARSNPPRLILLDVAMPKLDGLMFLKQLRSEPALASVPVIILTAISDKEKIVQAARLGAADYMLKSRFSLKDLIEKVKKHAGPPRAKTAGPAPSPQAIPSVTAKSVAAPVASVTPTQKGPETTAPRLSAAGAPAIPRLMDREQCLIRAHEAVQAKTLSGVVTQVMALASSPRGDMNQLASLIARDPMLSARVLATANSAAFSSKQGITTTIPQAVKQIGFNTVRNIAVAVGVFDVMPRSSADGFNPIGCWQHSFAVAQLCEQIEQLKNAENAPLAYIVGLCHELGELLIRAHFAAEYQQILEIKAKVDQPIEEIERQMLGLTHRQLKSAFIQSLGLPESIRLPIEAYQRGTMKFTRQEHLAEVLHFANFYANGLLLATGYADTIAPLTRFELRTLIGLEEPPRPEADAFRANICALTAMLAKLGHDEERRLMTPLYPRARTRVWFVRDRLLSSFDPIHAMLECISTVELRDSLPCAQDAGQYDAVIVVAGKSSAKGLTATDLRRLPPLPSASPSPLLWLVGNTDEPSTEEGPVPKIWPLSIREVADFVAAHAGANTAAPAIKLAA